MAKFVQVSYGSEGNTKLYTYLVNSSIKKWQTIYPAVKHYKNGNIFGTTGVVKKISSKMPTTEITPQEVTTYLTTSELGIPKQRSTSGKFMSTKGTYDEKGNYIASTTGNVTRAENIINTQAETFNKISSGEKTQKALETYDEYVAKINKGGKP